jgi:hypothetical protein
MMFNTQDYWIFLSLSIVRYFKKNTKERKVSETDPFSSHIREGRHILCLGRLERDNLNHWTAYVSTITAI